MIRRIIVEGPDCSGKSTVVKRIKNTLRWDSKSLHHIEGNQYERYLKEYSINEKTVFDRGHFSEAVYSEMWRTEAPFSNTEKRILNQIAQNNSIVIFARPPLKKMKERYLSRDYHQQISLEELEVSRNLFIKQMKNVVHTLYFSESNWELDNLIESVRRKVNEALSDSS